MSQSQETEATAIAPLSEIEELRDLIIGREAQVLADLRKRLDDPQLRAEELAGVLVETIRISQANGEDLAGAIEAPVQACIKQSIEKDTQFFADALFPVMGPAIRKSITEALKSLVQSLNATVDNNFSAQSFRWRLEAKRSGVTFGEVVLKHTLVYRVEQVLLVQRDTGLLMQHAVRPDIASKDGDAVSAMLTAIQDFVRDSFSAEGDSAGDLASIDVGEQTVWLINSPQATMACVIRGLAPMSLRADLQGVMEGLFRSHGTLINEFNGDQDSLLVLLPLLEQCFKYEQTKSAQQEGVVEGEFSELEDSKAASRGEYSNIFTKPAVYVFLLLTVVLIIAWSAWVHRAENEKKDRLLSILASEPGVLVTGFEWEDIDWYRPERRLVVRGLKDPVFNRVDRLVKEQLGYADERIDIQMHPYISLDESAQLQRAKKYLQPPSSVQLHIINGHLMATGSVRPEWFNRWDGKLLSLPNISSIDLSQLKIDLSIERQEFDQLRTDLQEHVFYFTDSKTVAKNFLATAQRAAQKLKQLHALSLVLGQTYTVQLTAYSDHVGGEALNAPVRRLRGEMVKNLLVAEGALSSLIAVLDGGAEGVERSADFSARRVNLAVVLGEPREEE